MSILRTVQDGSDFIKREGVNGLMLIAIVALLGYYVWMERESSQRLTEILIASHDLQRETNKAESLRSARIGEMIMVQRETTESLNALVTIALDKRLSDEKKQRLITDKMRDLVVLIKSQIHEKRGFEDANK